MVSFKVLLFLSICYTALEAQSLADLSTTTTSTTQELITKRLPEKGIPPSCNFDQDLCGWVQEYWGDNFDWTVGQGETPTNNTGPSKDHTSGYGKYLYTEANPPRRAYELTTLHYRFPKPISEGCLSLFYHMHGVSIGTLKVVVRDPRRVPTKLWSVRREQGNSWKNVKINITQQTSLIEISAVMGNGIYGDIAIDDIQFDPQLCSREAVNQGPQLVKRLEFEAVYHTDCSILNNAVSKEMLLTSAKSHTEPIRQICAGDCSLPTPLSPQVSCENGAFVVRWLTKSVYKASTVSLPVDLRRILHERILAYDKNDLKIIVPTQIPPFVYPTKNQLKELITAFLKTECADGSKYNEALNTCSN